MSGRLAMSPDTYLELVAILDLVDNGDYDEAERRLEALIHPPSRNPDDD